jgi:subtilisin-like proprotein convertase family protein
MYQPTANGSVSFPAPAPTPAYGGAMAALKSSTPNGSWSLYVLDDSPGDAGNIAQGWSLTLTTITSVAPLVNTAPARLSGAVANGQFHLTVTAQPGALYELQASTDLSSWVPVLVTNASLLDGTIEFSDTNFPGLSRRFYRALQSSH